LAPDLQINKGFDPGWPLLFQAAQTKELPSGFDEAG